MSKAKKKRRRKSAADKARARMRERVEDVMQREGVTRDEAREVVRRVDRRLAQGMDGLALGALDGLRAVFGLGKAGAK